MMCLGRIESILRMQKIMLFFFFKNIEWEKILFAEDVETVTGGLRSCLRAANILDNILMKETSLSSVDLAMSWS